MPKTETKPKEFLVVGIPDNATPGATLRLLGVVPTQAQGDKFIEKMNADTLGRVAVLERCKLYVRKAAVNSDEVNDPIISS